MKQKIISYSLATVLAAFALLTLFLSSSIIFDWFGIRVREGNYVLFIVWTNFVVSLMYLIAVYGFLKNKKWTAKILGGSALFLFIAFLGLQIHINTGGIYETKTVEAMIFRTSITLIFAVLAYFTISKKTTK